MLVGALAEGEIHVPRLGRIPAGPGFRLIAAMNPFDAVGTARVSQAIADRMCRIAICYQDAPGERRIVTTVTGVDGALPASAVELTRLTREHAQVRMGSSVRGAIDLVRLAVGPRPAARRAAARARRRDVRRRGGRGPVRPAARGGGLRADAGGDRARADRPAEASSWGGGRTPTAGKSAGAGPPPGAAGHALSGDAAREVVRDRGRRTIAAPPAGTPPRGAAAGLAAGRPARRDRLPRSPAQRRGRRRRPARRPRRRDRPPAARARPPARGAAVRPRRAARRGRARRATGGSRRAERPGRATSTSTSPLRLRAGDRATPTISSPAAGSRPSARSACWWTTAARWRATRSGSPRWRPPPSCSTAASGPRRA